MFFGRTDLRIDVSGAKFDAESDFEIRLAVAPQKPGQASEKLMFRFKNFTDFFSDFWPKSKRVTPNSRLGVRCVELYLVQPARPVQSSPAAGPVYRSRVNRSRVGRSVGRLIAVFSDF